jgi:hypothetical protein
LIVMLGLIGSSALGQEVRTTVRITDQYARPVPFALVSVASGGSKVADDSGHVILIVPRADSLRIYVRRMGFLPYDGWTRRAARDGSFHVVLQTVARQLDTVSVSTERNVTLERTGFYDRLRRVQRGAYAARLITPEELEMRNPIRITQMFTGETMVRATPAGGGRAILLGRGPKCAMTVLVDGMLLRGTWEEAINRRDGGPEGTRMYLDDLVPASSVAAIEIYGSNVSAPAELQQIAGGNGCGIVAIWTGGRR